MIKFDKELKSLKRVARSDLKNNQILERQDLQAAIVNSWDAFRNELKFPDLYLIGQEIVPHDDVNDRIDILAFDSVDSVPVIIELKRSKHKLQLLQAITYASMVASWSPDRFIKEAEFQNAPDIGDLKDTLEPGGFSSSTKIILLAEEYDPTVIISADWLYENYNVDINAYSLDVFNVDKGIYISLHQRYPLPELRDSYELRSGKSKQPKRDLPDISWDEISQNVQYEWGPEAISICLNEKNGDPKRRRFGSIRTNWDGFKWISLNFRREFVNVYICGKPDEAENILQDKFTNEIEIGTWRDGYSFKIKDKDSYQELFSWLKLNSKTATKVG